MSAPRVSDEPPKGEYESWIRDAVEPTGPLETIHVRAWSTVLRVPTADGDVWFKANAPTLRHEAELLRLLAARRPELVPEPIALDLDRGWMLLRDAGTRLLEVAAAEQALDRWLDVLPAYADLQLAVAGDVDELLEFGVPDLRLATLPERYERLVGELDHDDIARFRAAIPRVRELAAELAEFRLPETIQHDDLHDRNVFVGAEGGHRIIDWGDAVVSHPFFSLSVTLEGVIQWGLEDVEGSVETVPFRDAYLRPFGGGRELARAVEIALRLGWAARAVATHAAGHEEPERIPARLQMFLDGRV